jgi:hypothetical protein
MNTKNYGMIEYYKGDTNKDLWKAVKKTVADEEEAKF